MLSQAKFDASGRVQTVSDSPTEKSRLDETFSALDLVMKQQLFGILQQRRTATAEGMHQMGNSFAAISLRSS